MAYRNNHSNMFNHLNFFAIDFISLLVSFVISFLIKFGDFSFVNDSNWLSLLFIISLLNIIICVFSDPYKSILKRPYYEEIIRQILLVFYNLTAASIIFYIFKIGTLFSRQMILTMYFLYFVISLVLKYILKKILLSKSTNNTKKTSLLIICTEENKDDIIRNAVSGDFNLFEIHGLSVINNENYRINNIVEYSLQNNIEEILVAVNPALIDSNDYETLIKNGIGINFDINSAIVIKTEDTILSSVGINNTISVGLYSFTFGQTLYLGIKRILDLIIGFAGIILLIPFTLILKLCYIIAGDSDPIIFKQNRIGKNGKEIKIYKFRTMVKDADKILSEMLKNEQYRAEWDANQKFENDPRITKFGSILRKTSLDELPQLINVIKGDMSLIGPRPLVSGELEAHNGMVLYQQIKPGITGWWACNGRSNINYYERLELEYYYIKNVSVYLDFLCILRTINSVIKRDGAK